MYLFALNLRQRLDGDFKVIPVPPIYTPGTSSLNSLLLLLWPRTLANPTTEATLSSTFRRLEDEAGN